MAISKIGNKALGTGTVLQVVQGTTITATGTSSTSFVSTNLSATITPSSTSSKILCMVHTTSWIGGVVNDYSILTLYRNGTNLGGGVYNAFILNAGAYSPTYDTGASFHYVDSPSTTSACTYTLYLKSYAGNTVYTNDTNNINAIILMEIAG
jgi:hypothetical protein